MNTHDTNVLEHLTKYQLVTHYFDVGSHYSIFWGPLPSSLLPPPAPPVPPSLLTVPPTLNAPSVRNQHIAMTKPEGVDGQKEERSTK